ncbi:MAG TPA: hypothetical protein VJ553_05535 [Candidatus Paceibacterota bacterium]|nr:hypothetical protein [Candidatus Paceibacterota bacterium]
MKPRVYDLYLEQIRRGKVAPEEIRLERFSDLVRKILREDMELSLAAAFRSAMEQQRLMMEDGA